MQQLYGVILTKSEQMQARLEEDEALYQRTSRTLSVSFRYEGKTVSRALSMPASGETRALEICDAAMSCLNKHYKKDARVLESVRFGLTATGFSNEGSGVAERSISAFLKPSELKWEVDAGEVTQQQPSPEGTMLKFVVKKNMEVEEEETRSKPVIDWDEKETKKRSAKTKETVFSGSKPLIDWSEGATTTTKKKRDFFVPLAAPDTELCPVCNTRIPSSSIEKHVNGHFSPASKKAKQVGAIDAFFSKRET